MEFGHSEGTFTLKNFLVYLVKVPSELRNSQRAARESHFVFCHVWPRCKPPNVTTPKFFFRAFSMDHYALENQPDQAGLVWHLTLINSILLLLLVTFNNSGNGTDCSVNVCMGWEQKKS